MSTTIPGHPLYSELPLPHPKSIRLLRISPGTDPEPIELTLEVVNLEERPKYRALSHVWNPKSEKWKHPADAPTDVTCNKHPMVVTPNLRSALSRLRPQNSRFSTLRNSIRPQEDIEDTIGGRIWIDALCINQEDLAERGQQVSFMIDIYDRACEVIVWLGEDLWLNSGWRSLSWTRKLHNLCLPKDHPFYLIKRVFKVGQVALAHGIGDDEMLVNTRGLKDKFPAIGDPVWSILLEFFKNDWFHRIWCIQEVSENSLVTYLMGPTQVSGDDIALCSRWLIYNEYFMGHAIRHHSPSPFLSLTQKRTLDEMIEWTSHMKATDPRDKIFALLGLFSSEVYGDFIHYFLRLPLALKKQPLTLILRRPNVVQENVCIDEPQQFPSWIPRWDQSYPHWFGFLVRRPSGNAKLTIGEKKSWRELSLRGFEISQVAFIEPEMRSYSSLEKNRRLVQHLLLEVTERTKRYSGRVLLEAALVFTVTGGWPYNSELNEIYGAEGLAECLTNEPTREFPWCYKFFTTSDGYMGLGAGTIKLGDMICVLYGGGVMYILRPAGKDYLFIGECYTHGLMGGEAMRMLETGEVREQWFNLI
ncbi:hypothetical protein HYFRA_00010518 [Hymenoscyphus fraxineus]|uniref:Heterokaryon incompatibility domain-containing protein n=1 Tax=Hymenoscyphus fraxineus TaxID=746836 RepID=A0A9N9PS63_9HELO|nr:hypothetical protein HYFRA_00010518 [Hymenoscyphus fraxineus]